MRICEECGTERRITLLEQAVTTADGQMVIGLFGEGRCLCPSYALDALDLEALDNTRKEETASSEEGDELDSEVDESCDVPNPLEEAPAPEAKNKKPRPRT